MGKQEEIFLQGEGDAWFERNIYKMGATPAVDPILQMISRYFVRNEDFRAAEFGCSNGWRLNELEKIYSWACFGVDPSETAIANGTARYSNIRIKHGTTVAHPVSAGCMNLIIYGFCLYVCDPEDLCEIVAQGNNVLADEGYLIIHDFDPEFPHSVPNHHVPGLMTYKMDYSKLWLANPAYSLVAKQTIPDGTAVWLLKKDQKNAFPEIK